MKRKGILLIGAISALSFLGNAQVHTHNHDWSLSRGADGYESGESIVASDDGFVYSTGVFEQTVDFDPYSSAWSKSSNGARDVYISKHDKDGHVKWVRSFGGSSSESVVAITIDSESNIYITGRFHGTVDFNPSPFLSYTMSQGGSIYMNVYVSKFDQNGNFIWARQLEGTNALESTDIAIGYNDNVHISGNFKSQVDVNPSASGVQLLTSIGAGDQDGFCVTLDKHGVYEKSFHLKGSAADVSINSVVVDQYRVQYFTGDFEGTCDFDTGTAVSNLTSTGLGPDAFVMRVSHYSGFNWVSQLETSVAAYPKSIKLDANKNVYTVGNFSGNIDLNPTLGIHTDMHYTSNLKTSVYISKLGFNGNFIYGRSVSGTGPMSTRGDVYVEDLSVTSSGKPYYTGSFSKNVDFKSGVGSHNITAVGAEDGYICGLNTAGNLHTMKTIESHYSGDYVRNNGISLNNNEDIYTTGNFNGMANFNPSGTAFFGISLGGYDMFIHKLKRFQAPFGGPNFKSSLAADETEGLEIDVYPNPTSNFINLIVSGETSAQVDLYSMNGQPVYSSEHAAGTSSISMDRLSEGAYILQVTQGENVERIKVVKY